MKVLDFNDPLVWYEEGYFDEIPTLYGCEYLGDEEDDEDEEEKEE